MTGNKVVFDWDDAQAKALLGKIATAVGNTRAALDATASALVERVRLCFHDQADPWGAAWKALSSVTLKLRRDQGRKGVSILRDKGMLLASLAAGVGGDEATVHIGFADRPFAIHQWGGQAGRNRKVTIPARPALPIRKDGKVDMPAHWRDELVDVLTAHLGVTA